MTTVRVLGVRGSRVVADPAFSRYGGNTSCFELRRDGDAVIFDAGSGISAFRGSGRIHILTTHLHMDHIGGLYGWSAPADSAAELHFYGRADGGFEQRLKAAVGAPYWPVELDGQAAKVAFHEIEPCGEFEVDGLRVRTMPSNHPNGCLLYRVDDVVYALDCETDDATHKRLVDFARGARLMIWDASYPPDGLIPGWGHSTWRQGMEVADAAGVDRVLMAHYAPTLCDDDIDRLAASAGDDRCIFAKEGMEVLL